MWVLGGVWQGVEAAKGQKFREVMRCLEVDAGGYLGGITVR
jgi:hypothetical protein